MQRGYVGRDPDGGTATLCAANPDYFTTAQQQSSPLIFEHTTIVFIGGCHISMLTILTMY